MLDYETLIEKVLPSILRFRNSFPNDLERSMLCRDAVTKAYLLRNYEGWAKDMCDHEEGLDRKPFYEALLEDLKVEVETVKLEKSIAFRNVTPFAIAMFEYKFLDQDGDTKKIQAWKWSAWHDYVGTDEKLMQKHGYLAPPEFFPG